MSEKIVCVGFHKTGTTSFGTAVRSLGFRWKGWNNQDALLFHSGQTEKLLGMTDHYDCFEDFPWPLLYREIHDRHGKLKLVLTRRKTMDVWFDSLVRHCDRNPPAETDFRRYLYGIEHPREDPEHVKNVHLKHIEDVRAFAAKHDIPLLEICFENGDGWDVLCPFLDRPVPERPFPWSNQAPANSRKERLLRAWRRLGRLKG